jgi:hypothetical protein
MNTTDITNLELHGTVEVQVLRKAIQNSLDALGEASKPDEVSEFLTLQQISARILPKTIMAEQEDGWLL